MRFSDITGQDELKSLLARGVEQGRVGHAQLFSGPPGYGALPIAIAYAQYLNCTARRGGDSCGECPSCIKMAGLVHPDIHYVFPVNSSSKSASQKPVSDNFIAQWREKVIATGGWFDTEGWYEAIDMGNQQGLITRYEAEEIMRKLSFKSYEGEYKVVIIWLPEFMNPQAANALLKILEEPWEKTVFLMSSAAPQRLLPTILSRVQQIELRPIETREIEKFLLSREGPAPGRDGTSAGHSGAAAGFGHTVAPSGHGTISPEQASVVARLSRGDRIEAERLAGFGQVGDPDQMFDLFVQLMRLSYNDRHMELLEWADSVASMGREEQKQFLSNALRLLRESYMLNAGLDSISYLWGHELDFCKNFSPFIGNHNVEALAGEIERTIAQVSQNGNPRIVFPHFALTVSKLIVKK